LNPTVIVALLSVGIAGLALFLSWQRGTIGSAKAQAVTNTDLDRRVTDLEEKVDDLDERLKLAVESAQKAAEAVPKIEALDRLFSFRMDTTDKALSQIATKIDRLIERPSGPIQPH